LKRDRDESGEHRSPGELLERLAEVEIAAGDPSAAAAIYERNFGFARRTTPDGERITVGDSELKIVPAASRDGLAALWLECDDLDRVAAALADAGVGASPIRVIDGRRTLELDPGRMAGARIVIFDMRV